MNVVAAVKVLVNERGPSSVVQTDRRGAMMTSNVNFSDIKMNSNELVNMDLQFYRDFLGSFNSWSCSYIPV